MRRNLRFRMAIGVLLVTAWSSSIGCTHNYYYTGAGPGPCSPTVVGGPVVAEPSTSYGAICETPAGSTVITTRPSTSGGTIQVPVVNSSARPKVVVSEPAGYGTTRNGNKFGWRRSDPENIANVKVEGAYDETINR